MYIKLSYDGRIISTSAYPNRRVSSDVSLDSSNELVIEVDDGSIYYNDDWDDDSYKKGKVRYVGNTLVTYYDDDYESYKVGRVKTVGDTFIYW